MSAQLNISIYQKLIGIRGWTPIQNLPAILGTSGHRVPLAPLGWYELFFDVVIYSPFNKSSLSYDSYIIGNINEGHGHQVSHLIKIFNLRIRAIIF